MSTELTVVAQNIQELHDALAQYQPSTHNLLLPTTNLRFIAEDHRIVVNEAHLDPESDLFPTQVKKGPDTNWKAVPQAYGIAKRGLERLLTIAGGSAKVISHDRDQDGRVTMTVEVTILMPDGIERTKTGTYTWDTVQRIAEAERKHEESIDVEKPPKWFNGSLAKYKNYQRRKFEENRHRMIAFATSYAETGATNRAIRRILTLKDEYTPKEVQKPFICLHAIPPAQRSLDLNDPAIQGLISHYMLETGKFPPIHQIERDQAVAESRARLPQHSPVDEMSDAVAAGEVVGPKLKNGPTTGEAEPAVVEEIEVPDQNSNSADPRQWNDRPLEPEELRERMNRNPGDDSEPASSLLTKYHAAMSTLTGGDDDKRRRIQDYFYGAYSSKDMAAWQLGRLYLWVGTTKEVIDAEQDLYEWVPSDEALRELPKIIEAQAGDESDAVFHAVAEELGEGLV